MDNRNKVESLCERQPSDNLRNLDEIIDAYAMCHRDRAARYLRFFAEQPSLEKAIEFAALAKLPGGKRHPHQRRIPRLFFKNSGKDSKTPKLLYNLARALPNCTRWWKRSLAP